MYTNISIIFVCCLIDYRRTDFRELVKDLFSFFKTRIWMQKINPTHVAAFQQALYPFPGLLKGIETSGGANNALLQAALSSTNVVHHSDTIYENVEYGHNDGYNNKQIPYDNQMYYEGGSVHYSNQSEMIQNYSSNASISSMNSNATTASSVSRSSRMSSTAQSFMPSGSPRDSYQSQNNPYLGRQSKNYYQQSVVDGSQLDPSMDMYATHMNNMDKRSYHNQHSRSRDYSNEPPMNEEYHMDPNSRNVYPQGYDNSAAPYLHHPGEDFDSRQYYPEPNPRSMTHSFSAPSVYHDSRNQRSESRPGSFNNGQSPHWSNNNTVEYNGSHVYPSEHAYPIEEYDTRDNNMRPQGKRYTNFVLPNHP